MPTRRAALIALFALTAATAAAGPKADFTSKEWGFKIAFPNTPKEQTQAKKLDDGIEIKFTTFLTEAKDGGYLVWVADMPIPAGEADDVIQTRLDGARDGAVKNIGGTLKDSKKITLGKYPGREFTAAITRPKVGLVRARVYLVKSRLYQIMVLGPDADATSEEADEFLKSFQLTE